MAEVNANANIHESKIQKFFHSDFFLFMKNFMSYLILFSICFYLLFYIHNKTDNNLILMEVKYFFYITVIILFLFINNILETPQEGLKKFIIIILISLFISCLVNYIVVNYDKNGGFTKKFFIILLTTFIIFLIFTLIVFFLFEKKNKMVSKLVYEQFNKGIKKNFSIMVFLTIYLFFFYKTFSSLNINSNLSDIMAPFSLGLMLIFFIYIFLIYICRKLKIINDLQYLNTFLVLLALSFFFGMIGIYIFMNSLKSICVDGESKSDVNIQERLSLFIFLSIVILLWLDDSRNWHQIGYFLFIIITLFNFICFFYYMPMYPNIGIMSMWLMVEWLITFFSKKESSKNSIHYVFMKT